MEVIEARLQALERKARRDSLEDRREQLRQDGYTGSQDVPADRQQAKQARCDNCSHRGLSYFSVVRINPWGAVGFMVCPRCNHWIEF